MLDAGFRGFKMLDAGFWFQESMRNLDLRFKNQIGHLTCVIVRSESSES